MEENLTLVKLMQSPFESGGIVVNVSQNRITYRDEELELQPKVLELLVLLCAVQGETQSKQQLVEALWPDTVVGPDSLANTMTRLRKVLDDDAKNPKFIKTVQRKGYRWLQDVQLVKELNNYSKPYFWTMGCFVLIAFSLSWYFYGKSEPETFHFPDLQIDKLEDGSFEIQVGVEGELTEERKAAMLKELKRITGEEYSDMIFTVDPIKSSCGPLKEDSKDKKDCQTTLTKEKEN